MMYILYLATISLGLSDFQNPHAVIMHMQIIIMHMCGGVPLRH